MKEYKFLHGYLDALEKQANDLATEGWEVEHLALGNAGVVVIMSRKKAMTTPVPTPPAGDGQ